MDERDERDERQAGRPSLKAAVRRARIEVAAHSEAVDDLRRAEIARLEILEDALKPVLADAPSGVDLFDVGIALGERPRLFLDMVAYVDLGHDRRTYRFHQNTRHGRVLIAESASADRIIAAMTNYIARRLIEREQTLGVDRRSERAPTPRRASPPPRRESAREEAPRRAGGFVEFAGFLLMVLGAFTLFAIVALVVLLLLSSWGRARWAAGFGVAEL